MKVWMTLPFDDNGIRPMNAVVGGGWLSTNDFGGTTSYSLAYHREGVMWHRTKRAALKQAEKFRAERIAKAEAEVARLAALPPIAA